jgi:hypothetical protein
MDRIILAPSSECDGRIGNDGIRMSPFKGFDSVFSAHSVEFDKFDIMDAYASLLQFDSDGDAVREIPASFWARWTVASKEVHSHVSVRVRQRIQTHHSHHDSQSHGRSAFAESRSLISAEVVIQPSVVLVNSLPYDVQACLSPAQDSDDSAASDSAFTAKSTLFLGTVCSGACVSISSHIRSSFRISVRVCSSNQSLETLQALPGVICCVVPTDRRVSRCPVLVSSCLDAFPRFCDVRVETALFDGSQLRIVLGSPGLVRNCTNLPLLVQFFADADADNASSSECYLPPRPVVFDESSDVLKWWGSRGGLRDVLARAPEYFCADKDRHATAAGSRFHSPFQQSCFPEIPANDFSEIAMQFEPYLCIRLPDSNRLQRCCLKELRNGQTFSFDVCGIIHDVILEMKSIRGSWGETVPHISLKPLAVVTNRRFERARTL